MGILEGRVGRIPFREIDTLARKYCALYVLRNLRIEIIQCSLSNIESFSYKVQGIKLNKLKRLTFIEKLNN